MPVVNHEAATRLRDTMSASIDDGMRGQRLDGDPGSNGGGRSDSHPERVALREHDEPRESAEARADRDQLDAALATISRLDGKYRRTVAGQRPIPGLTDPAPDRCPICWAGGRSKKKAPGRKRCHSCQHFHDRYKRDDPEADYPAEVLRAHIAATARLTSEGMKREKAEIQAWDEPAVHRAWRAAGWVSTPGVRYPIGRITA